MAGSFCWGKKKHWTQDMAGSFCRGKKKHWTQDMAGSFCLDKKKHWTQDMPGSFCRGKKNIGLRTQPYYLYLENLALVLRQIFEVSTQTNTATFLDFPFWDIVVHHMYVP
jgi:hypothetical protein